MCYAVLCSEFKTGGVVKNQTLRHTVISVQAGMTKQVSKPARIRLKSFYDAIKYTQKESDMSLTTRQEPMQRKPIMMPPSMIKKVDSIAKSSHVSFAEIVRDAVNAFDGKATAEDEAMLEALADTMIKTTRELIEKMDAIEKQLDNTHALLEDR